MTTAFPVEVSDRICKHMNKDHADSVIFYATEYGGVTGVTAAEMVKIDALGMDLTVQVDGEDQPVRIAFDHELADAKEAHHVLVEMLKIPKE
jgi:putative heme iron utilization protein